MVLDHTPPASVPFQLLEGRSFNSCTLITFSPGLLAWPGEPGIHPVSILPTVSLVALIMQMLTDLHLNSVDSFHHIKAPVFLYLETQAFLLLAHRSVSLRLHFLTYKRGLLTSGMFSSNTAWFLFLALVTHLACCSYFFAYCLPIPVDCKLHENKVFAGYFLTALSLIY